MYIKYNACKIEIIICITITSQLLGKLLMKKKIFLMNSIKKKHRMKNFDVYNKLLILYELKNILKIE